jgi:DNA-binding protein
MKTMKVTGGAISSVVVASRVYRLMLEDVDLEDVELDYVDLEDVERQRLDLTRIKVNK